MHTFDTGKVVKHYCRWIVVFEPTTRKKHGPVDDAMELEGIRPSDYWKRLSNDLLILNLILVDHQPRL